MAKLGMLVMQVWYTDSDALPVITVWRPICPAGYAPLGHVIALGLDPPAAPVRSAIDCNGKMLPSIECYASRVCQSSCLEVRCMFMQDI